MSAGSRDCSTRVDDQLEGLTAPILKSVYHGALQVPSDASVDVGRWRSADPKTSRGVRPAVGALGAGFLQFGTEIPSVGSCFTGLKDDSCWISTSQHAFIAK